MNSPTTLAGDLSTTNAIVLGSNTIIGQACVSALRAEGASVAGVTMEFENPEKPMVGAFSPSELPLIMSVIEPPLSFEKCLETITEVRTKFGHIRVLINCAYVFNTGHSLELSEEDWGKSLEINVHGPFFFCQAFAQQSRADSSGGIIINISDISYDDTTTGLLAYSVAMATISGITRSLAIEWAHLGIRVNAIAPGHRHLIESLETVETSYSDAAIQRILRRVPAGRLATVKEITNLMLLLCSDKLNIITGQAILADGGYSINGAW